MVMNAWETLVASALVGTNRQSPSIDLTHPALADYGTALPTQSATQQILSAAGLIAAYQAVGNSPSAATSPLLAPATANELPCCSPSTARHLSSILNESRYEPILPEFLQLLAQAGQTMPPDCLPLLLERGKRNKSLRSLITPMLGSRGQWLVRQNPEWEYALGGAISSLDLAQLPEIWATGTRSERLAALTQWRQIQPAEARQAVAASWKQDKADNRQAWLEVLETNLSLEDEEFLEVALFDRSEPVREQAANLLRQLPSQYRQRLTKLASQCMTIKEKKNHKYKIEVNLSSIDNKELQAAGISNKTDSEAQLLKIISSADLDIWEGDIEQLVDAAMNLPYEKTIVIIGWITAACDRQRFDWIEALLIRSYSLLARDFIQKLLKSLPKTKRDFPSQFFTKVLTADNFSDNIERYLQIMMMHDDIWTIEVSKLVMQKFNKHIHKPNDYYYQPQNISNSLGRYLDPSILPALQEIQSELSIKRFSYTPCIELLEFRRDMRSAFNTA
jgi:Family of unknown function (DUF5691)